MEQLNIIGYKIFVPFYILVHPDAFGKNSFTFPPK